MIQHPAFPVEPWSLRENLLHVDVLAETESVFALSNGHIGWRATLDEGEPHGLPGTYLNGLYEQRPLPYTEAGFGYPESGQTMINVTNGKLIRLMVDDEPLDVRYGELRRHERVLDFRAGTLSRWADWVSPAGRAVRISSVRLVSLTQRSVGAICYQVESLDGPLRVVIQSELVANEQLPSPGGDPRVAAALEAPLEPLEHIAGGGRALLMHRTRHSDLTVVAGMHHHIACDATVHQWTESRPDVGRLTHQRAAGARPATAAGEVRRIWLVRHPLPPRAARPGGRRAGRGRADRLGRPVRRAAGLPGRLLEPG